jgi:hypothetical protein
MEGLMDLNKSFVDYLDGLEEVLDGKKNLDDLYTAKRDLLSEIQKCTASQVVLIQSQEVGGRVGMLQSQLLFEMRDLVAISYRLAKAVNQIKTMH